MKSYEGHVKSLAFNGDSSADGFAGYIRLRVMIHDDMSNHISIDNKLWIFEIIANGGNGDWRRKK